MVYGLSSIVCLIGIKKAARGRGGSRSLSDLLCSHRCHPNRKLSFNNKDAGKDDNKGEAEDRIHWLVISPDYRQKRKSVKGNLSDSVITRFRSTGSLSARL
jgi:hypothetical protein